MTNLNKLAQKITLAEGKKISISIAQVKEVLKLTLFELKKMTVAELTQLLTRVK